MTTSVEVVETTILHKYSETQIRVKGKKIKAHNLRELREAFRLFDKDGDGSISTEELGTVMRNLGQFPSIDELNQMLKEIDIDGDGTFSFEEFVQVMANVGGISENSQQDEEEELRQAFRVFDKSGCGYITPSDLRAVLQCMGEELTEEEIDEMIAEVDIDGDGRIDFEEFITCMRSEDHEDDDDDSSANGEEIEHRPSNDNTDDLRSCNTKK
uniref:EF-hand domain-containing protein n=1 Tax=Arion vulgaris TaxID=1028688 RepID=A0A0B6ZYD0_9EUPU